MMHHPRNASIVRTSRPTRPASRGRWAAAWLLALTAGAASGGCSRKPSAPPQQPPVPVITVLSEAADVPIHHEYPGTTASVRLVEINARVEGWVTKQNFTDGQMVKEGMVLYEIDPRPYEVALEQALADLAVAEAEYQNAKQKVDRNRPLVELDAISAEQFDQLVANARSTQAMTEARRAAVDQARLNLSYCTVRALGSGQISRTQVYVGTLVGPAVNNRMTNIQALDPIWVEFYPIAADIPALRRLLESQRDEVLVSMPPGDWTAKGRVVFINNQVDPTTDTILARVQLSNPNLDLVPGAYVRVNMPVETLTNAVTIPETAIVHQTAATLVWVVQPDGTAKSKVVETGPHGGSGIVVTSGLTVGERVVVHGQQKLREGSVVLETPPAGKKPAADAPPATDAHPAAGAAHETGSTTP